MNHAYDEHLATNRYFDRHFESDAAKILPGEYYVTSQEIVLVTVLGSCVAACIRDTDSGIGGMNHFMLPDEGGREVVSSSARYGTYAMEVLINHLLKMGARRSQLEAKIFGGGAVMSSLTSSQSVRRAIFKNLGSSWTRPVIRRSERGSSMWAATKPRLFSSDCRRMCPSVTDVSISTFQKARIFSIAARGHRTPRILSPILGRLRCRPRQPRRQPLLM